MNKSLRCPLLLPPTVKDPLWRSPSHVELVTIRTFTNVSVLQFPSTKIYDLPSAPSESYQWPSYPNPPSQPLPNQWEHPPNVLRNCPRRVPLKYVWIPNNAPQPNSSWPRARVKGSRGGSLPRRAAKEGEGGEGSVERPHRMTSQCTLK